MRRDLLILTAICIVAGALLYLWEDHFLRYFSVDWNIVYYPAAQLLLHGENPYQVAKFHNPVWALLPLMPFTWLGTKAGGFAWYLFTFLSFAHVAYHFKARPVALGAFLLSPLVFYNQFLNNIDGLVLLGLLLPAPVGLFLAAMKPQLGLGMAIYWAYEAWKSGGVRKVALTFLPVLAALGASVLIYGDWWVDKSDHLIGGAYWNASLFPWSIPVGLALAFMAIRNHRPLWSAAASPFMSPYLSLGTWSVALMSLLDNNLLTVCAVLISWPIFVASRLG